MKIKNKMYRKFLDEGAFDVVTEDHIKQALTNIKGRYALEGKALLIMLFYSGARPAEVMEIKGQDVSNERKIIVKVKGVKRGLPRTLMFPSGTELSKILWDYCSRIPLNMYLFWHYRTRYKRKYKTKDGIKEILDTSNGLRNHFNKWFEGVFEHPPPPYYLRHNRFSTFAEKGASIQDIQMWKGSRKPESVMPYLHMTTSTSKKMSRLL